MSPRALQRTSTIARLAVALAFGGCSAILDTDTLVDDAGADGAHDVLEPEPDGPVVSADQRADQAVEDQGIDQAAEDQGADLVVDQLVADQNADVAADQLVGDQGSDLAASDHGLDLAADTTP